jgi:hypothetical protein
MGKYTSGGKIKTTTVVGNAAVGFHDVDGGVNIIIDDAGHTGAYHPSQQLLLSIRLPMVAGTAAQAFSRQQAAIHR